MIIRTNRIRITTFGEARSRSASKENSSAAIAEWTVDYIGVTSDPTKARHTSEDFSRFVVEHTLYDDVELEHDMNNSFDVMSHLNPVVA